MDERILGQIKHMAGDKLVKKKFSSTVEGKKRREVDYEREG